jgi:hypothetical protein
MSPTRRELRPAHLRSIKCDYRFRARVWLFGHDVEEGDLQNIRWIVDNTEGVICRRCGFDRLAQVEK